MTIPHITPNLDTFSIMTESGYSNFNGVSRIHVTDHDVITITFNDIRNDSTEKYTFTLDHVVYDGGVTILARDIARGQTIDSLRVVETEYKKYTGYLYDVISVDNDKSNFNVGNDLQVNSSNCVVGSSKTKYRNRCTGVITEMTMLELKDALTKKYDYTVL